MRLLGPARLLLGGPTTHGLTAEEPLSGAAAGAILAAVTRCDRIHRQHGQRLSTNAPDAARGRAARDTTVAVSLVRAAEG